MYTAFAIQKNQRYWQLSLKRSGLDPKLLRNIYRNSCTAYRLVTNLVTSNLRTVQR